MDFFNAPVGSTAAVALMDSIFPHPLTIAGVRGAAGGRQPTAAKPPCIVLYSLGHRSGVYIAVWILVISSNKVL